MKFKTLTLEDIRSYENGTIDFEEGENLLFGKNGSGKSTILQGVFGGLFQTKIKYQVGNDFDLPDLVRKQADEGTIELVFEAAGHGYTVEWRVKKKYDDEGEVDGAKTKQGYPRLSSDALDEDVSGLGDVQAEIQRIIGMDAESFVNSVYVQQGDITRLIHADTETRRKILDGLLGLNQLDEYVERMEDVRREYKKAKRDANTRLDETQNRLDNLPHMEDVQDDLTETSAKISDRKEKIEDLESKVDSLEDQRDELTDKLDRIDDLQRELEEKREDSEDAKSTHDEYKAELQSETEEQQEAEAERDEKADTLANLTEHEELADYDLDNADAAADAHDRAQTAAEEARSELQSIEEGRLASLQSDRDHVTDAIADTKQSIEDAKGDLEDAREAKTAAEDRKEAGEERVADHESALEAKRKRVANLVAELDLDADASLDELERAHIPEKRETLSDARETAVSKKSRLETLQDQVDELEREGQCPVCKATGDAHDIDPGTVAAEHENDLEATTERLAELDDERQTLTELTDAVRDAKDLRSDLEDARNAVSDAEDDIADAEDDIADAESKLESLRDELGDHEDERDRINADIEAAKEDLEAAEERVDEAETVERLLSKAVDLHERIAELETEIDQHEQNRERIGELRRQAFDRMSGLEDEVSQLEDDLGDLDADSIQSDIDEIDEFIGEFESDISEKEEKVEQLQHRIAELNQQKNEIREATERKSMLADQREWATDRVSEATEVITKYKEVRGKLRRQNLAKLNEYTNDVFSDLYQSQSYRGVRIDKKYNIRLVTQENEMLKPQLSSGGESGILNLALRAGVYKIIAERDGVAGAALPPFILDEPTVFLDSDHVGELKTMIKTISEWNVPQILLVSHDETLIENSDHAILVEKDSQSETSCVRPGHAAVAEATGNSDSETDAEKVTNPAADD